MEQNFIFSVMGTQTVMKLSIRTACLLNSPEKYRNEEKKEENRQERRKEGGKKGGRTPKYHAV